MEYLNTFTECIINADLTGINIDLPDELKEEIMMAYANMAIVLMKIANHIYGDEITDENYQEAAIIAGMVYRQMTGNDKPLNLG